MSVRKVMTAGGVAIWEEKGRLFWTDGMAIDADGSPRCYGPNNTGLDYTGNGGHPGNWWGVVTKNGIPVIQSGAAPEQPYKGLYISKTSYYHKMFKETDVRRWVNSEEVPFIVVPGPLINKVKGIVMGCRARITFNGKSIDALVADAGPSNSLGEASIAAAKDLGIPSNPRKGGRDTQDVAYEIWPGEPAVVNGVEYDLIPAS